MSLLLDTSASIEYTDIDSSSSLSGLQVVTALKYQQEQQQAISNSDLPLQVETSGGNSAVGSFTQDSDVHTLTLITPSYYSNIQSVIPTSSNAAGASVHHGSLDYKSLKFVSIYVVVLFATGILAL